MISCGNSSLSRVVGYYDTPQTLPLAWGGDHRLPNGSENVVKRVRATSLLQEMLTRLDVGERPLDLVDAVHVFGSYARGALEPADVDVAVTHHVDADFSAEVVSGIMYGRDPTAPMKRALKGNKRGIQFQFNQNDAFAELGTELTPCCGSGATRLPRSRNASPPSLRTRRPAGRNAIT